MARRGMVVDEVHPVRWAAPSALNRAILDLMGTEAGYRTSSASLDRMTFTRTFRPNWAVAGAVVLGITGIGLFFLLVRSTETFTCAIDDDHAGVKLRVHGRIPASVLAELRKLPEARLTPAPAALPSAVPHSERSPLLGGPQSPASPGPWLLGSTAGLVVPPPVAPLPLLSASLAGAAVPPQEAASGHSLVAVRADESTRVVSRVAVSGVPAPASGQWAIHIEGIPPIEMNRRVVVGRNPAMSDDGLAQLVPVADQSVSKTHAEFGVDDGGPWVLDRYSTNGTRIIDLTGERAAAPGEREALTAGAVVRLGEVLVRVEVQ